MAEYVYCIINKAMQGKCKCGGTSRTPDDRCRELFNTSLPLKCTVEYSIKVNNYKEAEKYIHDKIISAGFIRYDGREWFECNPNDIKYIYDEYSELYPYDKNYKKPNGQTIIKNIKNIKNITINNMYACPICNYETTARTALYNHNKSDKHLINVKNEALNKENEKLKLKDKEIEELKKEIKKLEVKVQIYKELLETSKK
jgi:hypothetical protein